jgi:hypothetical protein
VTALTESEIAKGYIHGTPGGAMKKTLAAILALSAFSAQAQRSYVGGNFALNLDGVKEGFLKSVDGGAISAEVSSNSDKAATVMVELYCEKMDLEVGPRIK